MSGEPPKPAGPADAAQAATTTDVGGEAGAAPSEAEKTAKRRARGLTLWAIIAIALSPFSIPTSGFSFVVALGLVGVALLMRFRGFNATRPLIAGIVAVSGNLVSAGACSYLFLRTAEVTGREAVRQDRVEDRFDEAFDDAEDAPQPNEDSSAPQGGAEVPLDANSPSTRQEP
jgi:hypothetical protein